MKNKVSRKSGEAEQKKHRFEYLKNEKSILKFYFFYL